MRWFYKNKKTLEKEFEKEYSKILPNDSLLAEKLRDIMFPKSKGEQKFQYAIVFLIYLIDLKEDLKEEYIHLANESKNKKKLFYNLTRQIRKIIKGEKNKDLIGTGLYKIIKEELKNIERDRTGII